MPISTEVLAHAAAQPQWTAIRCGERVRTYRGLGRDVVAAAAFLRADGLRPGDLVAIGLPDPVAVLTTALAADLAGAIPLICDPSWGENQRAVVLGSVSPDMYVDRPPSPASSGTTFTDTHVRAPDDLAWASFTSGSTGRPRAVVRTGASWTGSYEAVSRLTAVRGSDTVLVPGGLASSLYAFAALHTLATGATLLLTPRSSPALLRASVPAADLVHLVPHTLDIVVTHLEAGGRSALRAAVVGGAALPRGLRERAAAVGVDVVSYYGAAELSFVAVDADGAGLRPFPGVQIDLRPVPGSGAREVWVRSPWIARGYLAGARGPFRRDADGWVSVGDLADAGMPLRLRGRGDGALLTGGATVVPEDVESVLSAVPGVSAVVVVGARHEYLGSVVTAVVESGGSPVSRSALESAARTGLSPAQRPRRWLAIEALPRTASGKPARALIRAGVATGDLRTRPIR